MSNRPNMTSSSATVDPLIFWGIPACYGFATAATKSPRMPMQQGFPAIHKCYESATALLQEGRSVAPPPLIEEGATPAPSAPSALVATMKGQP